MSDTPTHGDVLAAIDKARSKAPTIVLRPSREKHCDDLRATAERHAPSNGVCGYCYGFAYQVKPWPCPDARQVIDRLTGWGAL